MKAMRILVTGASSGIGRAIALRLATDGHELILHGRDLSRLEETKEKLAGGNHVVWAYNLKDLEGIESSLGSLLDAHRIVLDGIVHSAGVVAVRPLRLFTPVEAGAIMAVNYSAALEITRVATLKKWSRESLRSIVFISSIASQQAPRGFGPYAAGKAAVEALARSLALELAPRIRVNCIRPGPIPTPGNLVLRQAAGDSNELPPLGAGTPDDIASAVVFLLSDASRWMTGQIITIDGGQSLL